MSGALGASGISGFAAMLYTVGDNAGAGGGAGNGDGGVFPCAGGDAISCRSVTALTLTGVCGRGVAGAGEAGAPGAAFKICESV